MITNIDVSHFWGEVTFTRESYGEPIISALININIGTVIVT